MRSDIFQEISKSRWKSIEKAKAATETEIMVMRELLDDIYGFYYAGGQLWILFEVYEFLLS